MLKPVAADAVEVAENADGGAPPPPPKGVVVDAPKKPVDGVGVEELPKAKPEEEAPPVVAGPPNEDGAPPNIVAPAG